MSRQAGKISQGVRKWAVLCGGVALLAGAVVIGMLSRGARTGRGDSARLAAEQLTVRAKSMIEHGQFDAAAGAVDGFFARYPDAPGTGVLWALKVVSHRKGGDSTNALLTVAAMAEGLQDRGKDLFDAGDCLAEYECYQDAAKAYELAARDDSVRLEACCRAADCNYRLGRYAMAMKFIDLAAALKPNDPRIIEAVKRIEDARFVADK